ncbi:endochitinase [Flagelloscypha sp. PMI_526]|nr:endochitinase [Flagelloscypha sp. PMI_526]
MPLLPFTLLLLATDVVYAVVAPRAEPASKLSSGWYPGWRSTVFPVTKLTWAKYDHISYAFAEPTPDPSKLSLENSGDEYLSTFVEAAHKHNTTASVSIGGWGGSKYFSSAVGSAENRTAFSKALTDLVEKYDLDGIDFDWEFPNSISGGCNIHSNDDVPNFITFIQDFRKSDKGSSLILSAAVFNTPYNDSSSPPKPMTDLKAFGEPLDFISIMNYDVWNSWASNAGPNAPLNDTCASQKRGSAVSAVNLWTAAGIPAEKIVLGIPYYGRSFPVRKSDAIDNSTGEIRDFPPYNVNDMKPSSSDDVAGVDMCGVKLPASGIYGYDLLIEKGRLNQDGKPADGLIYKWDNCSQTPILYNSTSELYISYDNEQSIAAKGAFINDMGLKGFGAWDVTTDYGDQLLDSIGS